MSSFGVVTIPDLTRASKSCKQLITGEGYKLPKKNKEDISGIKQSQMGRKKRGKTLNRKVLHQQNSAKKERKKRKEMDWGWEEKVVFATAGIPTDKRKRQKLGSVRNFFQ